MMSLFLNLKYGIIYARYAMYCNMYLLFQSLWRSYYEPFFFFHIKTIKNWYKSAVKLGKSNAIISIIRYLWTLCDGKGITQKAKVKIKHSVLRRWMFIQYFMPFYGNWEIFFFWLKNKNWLNFRCQLFIQQQTNFGL